MNKIIFISIFLGFQILLVSAQSYAPQVGFDGTTAIHKDNVDFVDWASNVSVTRGYKNIAQPDSGFVDYGVETSAVGNANTSIISLGDGGEAIITFNNAITNGLGADFAIFENGFLQDVGSNMAFLELAFVEVSTDGVEYVRFTAISENQIITQIDGFGYMDARYINNFAGKYIQDYGTPFDLEELTSLIIGTTVDLNNINYIKLIDVVGTINTDFSSFDSENTIVNDPYPTAFSSGGFDLNAVGVIHNSSTAAINNLINDELIIYPNPSSNFINIQLNDLSNLKINIFTLDGKLLISTSNPHIDISNFDSGVYLIKVKNNSGVYFQKIIKK